MLDRVKLTCCKTNMFRYLASGSGDTTVRLGDLTTERPPFICKGHKHWVLCIAWSCDGRKLASGCKSGEVRYKKVSANTQILLPRNKYKQNIDFLVFSMILA